MSRSGAVGGCRGEADHHGLWCYGPACIALTVSRWIGFLQAEEV